MMMMIFSMFIQALIDEIATQVFRNDLDKKDELTIHARLAAERVLAWQQFGVAIPVQADATC